MSYQLPPVLQRIKEIGGVVFDGPAAYDLNLFGIRSPNRAAGRFDDLMGCAYREAEGGPFKVSWWPATTDPGVYWLRHPMRREGCAILVGDRQYRGMWRLGLHRKSYTALVQVGECAGFRDADRTAELSLDESSIMVGRYGINGHASIRNELGTGEATHIGKASAGCQVHATQRGFDEMIALAQRQVEHHPTWETFTYTLLHQWW